MGRGLGGRAFASGPGAGAAQGVGNACSAGQVDFGSAESDGAGLAGGASLGWRTARAVEVRRFGRRGARRVATPGVGLADAQGGALCLVEVLRPA
eukprot:9376564-Alexandrium_andersonii.AAC.1